MIRGETSEPGPFYSFVAMTAAVQALRMAG
jgi:hypothetical protein